MIANKEFSSFYLGQVGAQMKKITKNIRVGCNKAKSFFTKTISNLLQYKTITKSSEKK